jgi:hypothetical protein
MYAFIYLLLAVLGALHLLGKHSTTWTTPPSPENPISTYDPSYTGGIGRKTMVWGQLQART